MNWSYFLKACFLPIEVFTGNFFTEGKVRLSFSLMLIILLSFSNNEESSKVKAQFLFGFNINFLTLDLGTKRSALLASIESSSSRPSKNALLLLELFLLPLLFKGLTFALRPVPRGLTLY